jgi:hypothetical protein
MIPVFLGPYTSDLSKRFRDLLRDLLLLAERQEAQALALLSSGHLRQCLDLGLLEEATAGTGVASKDLASDPA